MRVLIFANGEVNHPEAAKAAAQDEDLVIAADGGSRHCLSLGITPHILIGDLDSTKTGDLDTLRETGTQIIRHPVDKDETDLELALCHAMEVGGKKIRLFGLLGGRWDMTFANLLFLADPRFADVDIQVMDGPLTVYLVRGGETLTLSGEVGDRVSVVPLKGDAVGVTYSGLAYTLQDANLPFGTPRGVSNMLVNAQASITLKQGVLLCFVERLGNKV